MTTNNEHPYSNKLETALAGLAAGIPKKEILAGANGDAEWLASMLEIATEVGELRHSIHIPPPDASLQRLLAHAETLAAVSEAVTETNQPASLSSPPGRTGLFMRVAIALLLIGALLGSLNIAAQDALPGDLLYPVKKTSETLRLYLPWNFEQRAPSFESTPPALIVPSPTASPSSTATPTETPLPPTATSTSVTITNPVVVNTPSPTETTPTDIPTDNDTSDVDIKNEADLNDNTNTDNKDVVDPIDSEDNIDDSVVDDIEGSIEDSFDDSNDAGNNNDADNSNDNDGFDDSFDDSSDNKDDQNQNNDTDDNKGNQSDDDYEDEGENPDDDDDNLGDDNGSDDDKGDDDSN